MKTCNIIILAAAFVMAAACGQRNTKDTAAEANEMTAAENIDEIPASQMVGAFTEPREITPEELDMFKKATTDYAELQLVPQNVSTQVVSGINYKFFCDCKEGYNLSRCDVIIYKPLDGEPSVTKIQMK